MSSYKTPLMNISMRRDPDARFITEAEIKAIFGPIELILSYNQILLKRLEERMQSWDSKTSVLGDIFVEMADYLKMYRGYINSYEISVETLKGLKQKSKKFNEFLEHTKEDVSVIPQFARYDLEDFLITPIQRVPRYRLLLETLLKFTDQYNKDYEYLQTAIVRVKQVAEGTNRQQKIVSQMQTLAEIGRLYSLPIVKPGRELIKEGRLRVSIQKQKMENNETKIQVSKFAMRNIYLFNDLILIGKNLGFESERIQ